MTKKESELGLTHRLRVFENRVLRKIFGPKRDKVTGSWADCASGASSFVVFTKYHWGSKIKRNEMGRTCGTYGGEDACIWILVGET
jgi:hypothetical protein